MRLYSVPREVMQDQELREKMHQMIADMSTNTQLFVPDEFHSCQEPALIRFLEEMGYTEKFEAWLRLQQEAEQ